MTALPGACAKLATFTCALISSSTRFITSAWSARRFTPKLRSVLSFTCWMACSSSSKVMVAAAKMPRPPAAEVADVSFAPETQPMPVWMMG
jgi:hypothetical protein